jgi:hypothetical protein
VVKSCEPLVTELESSGVIKQICLADVILELTKRTLTTDQVVNCMKYWVSYRSNHPINAFDLNSFLKNLIISFPPQGDGKQPNPMPLANVNYFVNQKSISPPTLPLPRDVLPLEISKHFSKSELEACFGSLVELSIADWVAFISTNKEFLSSPFMSEKVGETKVNLILGSCLRWAILADTSWT